MAKPVEPIVETLTFLHKLPVSMPVAGLDLSLTSSAVSILTPTELTVHRFRSGDLRGVQRLKWLVDNIARVVVGGQVQLALLEGYSFGSKTHAHSLGELGGIVKLWLSLAGVPLATASPGCWKKALTGSGVPKGKGAVTLELYKRFGIECPQDDMADGTSLGIVAAMATGQIVDMPKLHLEALGKIEYVQPLAIPKVRHRERPDGPRPGEELREKSATGLQNA